VRFFGYADDRLKFDLMIRAHAVLVPGMREGWGLVVTEANSCGTPATGMIPLVIKTQFDTVRLDY
jgi:glycosyltransferase involved in cell wall biosynthesis